MEIENGIYSHLLLREARIQKLYSSARALMVKMPAYLKKVLSYFKDNEIPRDILISVGSAVAGAFVFDRILRRDEEEDEDS